MPATEYHLALDMAKHLALMENNPRGHAYRQRLIDVEKMWRQAQRLARGEVDRLVGVVRELEQRMKQIEADRVNDPRQMAVMNKSASEYAIAADAVRRKRRSLTLRLNDPRLGTVAG
jgi:hypothetical protein